MPYKCDKCGIFFIRQSQLNNHINRKTSCIKQKNLSCDLCDNTFSTSYSLNRHKLNCSATKSYDSSIKDLKNIIEKQNKIIEKFIETVKNGDNSVDTSSFNHSPVTQNLDKSNTTNNNDNSTNNITVNISMTDVKLSAFRTSDMVAIIRNLFDTKDADFKNLLRTITICARRNKIKTAISSLMNHIHNDPKNKNCRNIRICKDGKYKGKFIIYDYDKNSDGGWYLIDMVPVAQIISNELDEIRSIREKIEVNTQSNLREILSKKELKNIACFDEESMQLYTNIDHRNTIYKIVKSFKISDEETPVDINTEEILKISDSDDILSNATKKYIKTKNERHKKDISVENKASSVKTKRVMTMNAKSSQSDEESAESELSEYDEKSESNESHESHDEYDPYESDGRMGRSLKEEAELQKRLRMKERDDKLKEQEKIEKERKEDERLTKEKNKLEEKERKIYENWDTIPINNKIPDKFIPTKKTKKD